MSLQVYDTAVLNEDTMLQGRRSLFTCAGKRLDERFGVCVDERAGKHTEKHPDRSCAGSTLIWVMVVTTVIVLLLAVILTMVSRNNTTTTDRHIRSQAYYSALSVANSVANWIANGTTSGTGAGVASSSGTPEALLQALDATTTTPKSLTFAVPANPDAAIDSGSVTVSYVPGSTAGLNDLLVEASIVYRNASDTASVELAPQGSTFSGPETGFDPAMYDPKANELNAFTPYKEANGTTAYPQIVGRVPAASSVTTTDQANDKDRAALAAIASNSNREAIFDRPLISSSSYDEIIGTYYAGSGGGGSNGNINTRIFVTPPNGKITVNPLRYTGGPSGAGTPSPTSSNNNSQLTSLAVGDTAGKDVYLRLAGQDYKSIYNNTSNSYDFNSDNRYYNSLMAFDFVDNYWNGDTSKNTAAADIRYYTNERYSAIPANTFHPIQWNSGTIYTQKATDSFSSKGLYGRLVFGGYYQKYDYWLDYHSWGRNVSNPWYGQTGGDFYATLPTATDGTAKTTVGMPNIPVFWGYNFDMYLLDDDANNRGAMLLQGVNIVNKKDAATGNAGGVIYSLRGLSLGGALTPTSSASGSGQTIHNVNNGAAGLLQDCNPIYENYAIRTLRWDQQIVDTDIVLLAPAGKTRTSEIWAPESWKDSARRDPGTYHKQFDPIEKIVGGHIYIGSGQTLLVHGTNNNHNDKMQVSPDQIIVDAGATLTLESSTSQNVLINPSPENEPDKHMIYVRSGTMNVEVGARITSDISCYKSTDAGAPAPKLTIKGGARVTGDIYCDGNLTIEAGAIITGTIYLSETATTNIASGVINNVTNHVVTSGAGGWGIVKYSS
ncbi:hypothetical protein FACS1894104_4160 [Actinomycetota bacterium]|nr:hypothetical protein FACS1894104_4160 [Actinomycetota bacterium]